MALSTMAHHFTFVRLTPMHPDCSGSSQNDEYLQMLFHLHALLYGGAVLSRIEGVGLWHDGHVDGCHIGLLTYSVYMSIIKATLMCCAWLV